MPILGNGRPGTIRVFGGILQPPLLDTHEATLIEFYDQYGDMNAVLFRQFSDDMWALVTKKDPDWTTTLVRLGYLQPASTLADVLAELKAET